jgi:hypothetical protein
MDAIVVSAFYKHLAFLGGVLLSTATLTGDEYLKWVGPKPLRFAEMVPRRNPAEVLPALRMNDEPILISLATEEFGPQPAPPTAPGSIDETSLGAEPVEMPAVDSAPAASRHSTPDVLLQYFVPTHRKGGVISTPVDFTPPSSGAGRSSTATYQSQ